MTVICPIRFPMIFPGFPLQTLQHITIHPLWYVSHCIKYKGWVAEVSNSLQSENMFWETLSTSSSQI